MLDQLERLHRLQKKQFPSDKAYYDFLMFQIQSHMVEIDDLRQKTNPQLKNEVADMAAFISLLAVNQGVDDKLFGERLKKAQDEMKNQ